jgi:hypothetical protein
VLLGLGAAQEDADLLRLGRATATSTASATTAVTAAAPGRLVVALLVAQHLDAELKTPGLEREGVSLRPVGVVGRRVRCGAALVDGRRADLCAEGRVSDEDGRGHIVSALGAVNPPEVGGATEHACDPLRRSLDTRGGRELFVVALQTEAAAALVVRAGLDGEGRVDRDEAVVT